MPLFGSWCTSESSSSWKCQKWSSDLIVVVMESSTCWGIFWLSRVMVPLSMKGLKGLPVFTLEHHFKLFPASFVVIGFFGIDVEVL